MAVYGFIANLAIFRSTQILLYPTAHHRADPSPIPIADANKAAQHLDTTISRLTHHRMHCYQKAVPWSLQEKASGQMCTRPDRHGTTAHKHIPTG